MTLDEAKAVLGRLVLAYPQAKTNEGLLRLYLDTLKALPYGVTDAACRELALTATFLPALSEIVRAVGISSETMEDGRRATAQLAYAIRCGREMVRDLGSSTRWAIGVARIPVPEDQGEALALPAPVVSDEQAAVVRGMLAMLGGGLGTP